MYEYMCWTFTLDDPKSNSSTAKFNYEESYIPENQEPNCSQLKNCFIMINDLMSDLLNHNNIASGSCKPLTSTTLILLPYSTKLWREKTLAELELQENWWRKLWRLAKVCNIRVQETSRLFGR